MASFLAASLVVIAIGCATSNARSRLVELPAPVGCTASADSLRLHLREVSGDMRPGGHVEVVAELLNCTAATYKMSKWPGLMVVSICPQDGSATGDSPEYRGRGCPHGCDEPAEILELHPGDSVRLRKTTKLTSRCHAGIDLYVRYESSREDLVAGLIYPPDLWTGELETDPVSLTTR
jgi:hypothetical protein